MVYGHMHMTCLRIMHTLSTHPVIKLFQPSFRYIFHKHPSKPRPQQS